MRSFLLGPPPSLNRSAIEKVIKSLIYEFNGGSYLSSDADASVVGLVPFRRRDSNSNTVQDLNNEEEGPLIPLELLEVVGNEILDENMIYKPHFLIQNIVHPPPPT